MKNVFKAIVVAVIQWEAKVVLKKYKPRIVGITGSVGKTSTKDAVYTVFATKFFVRKSEKSYNSEIGVPLTILGCPNAWNNPLRWMQNFLKGLWLIMWPHEYPQWLILEVGADRPGDIQKLVEWVKPDVGIMTRLGKVPVHVEYFETPQDLVKEKAYLVHAIKRSGVMVLNHDDADVFEMRNLSEVGKITFGMNAGSDFLGTNVSIIYDKEKNGIEMPKGIGFKVDSNGNSVPVFIPGVLGYQHVYPALAAIAAGASQGINLTEMAEALSAHTAPKGRMRIIPGVKNTLVIDDTYNSSPVALAEALRTIGSIKIPGKKIVVLGDMLELGRYSTEEHKKAGEAVVGIGQILVTVGMRSRYMAEGALNMGMEEKNIFQFEDARTAGKLVESLLKPGDLVFVKGSQSIRMERIVEEIMAEPEKKEELLVRQDAEWQARG